MPAVDMKKLSDLVGKGLLSEFAPDILRGTLVELFRAKKVTVALATEWVERNVSLWDSLSLEYQGQMKRLAQKVGGVPWLDANWAINALKDDFPALASLFLGWRKAHNWLERQLDIIKRQVKQ